MKADRAPVDHTFRGRGRSPDRRALCVWIGTLASWREGLVMRLVRECGSVAGVLELSPDELRARVAGRRRRGDGAAAGASARPAGDVRSTAEAATDAARFAATLAEDPETCLRRMERGAGQGGLVVAWSDPVYPAQLRKSADPPLCLFVRAGGDAGVARRRLSDLAAVPSVAVVGTRAPSPYGEEMARMLGRDLTRAGLIVVSGMAMGIDAMAQSSAVEAARGERPCTVAVLGCGADVVYPRQNAALYARVVAGGLVLSEFAWGVPARAWRFPARNRVMAALGRAVVLVEGAERSGARITAGFAVDFGREVLCVPGEAGRRLSAAPNSFLREGAKLCESAADVLRAIAVDGPSGGGDGEPRDEEGEQSLDEVIVLDHGEGAVRDVLQALGAAPHTVDELTRRCGLPAWKVAAAVGELEVEGLARRVDGGRYRLQRR